MSTLIPYANGRKPNAPRGELSGPNWRASLPSTAPPPPTPPAPPRPPPPPPPPPIPSGANGPPFSIAYAPPGTNSRSNPHVITFSPWFGHASSSRWPKDDEMRQFVRLSPHDPPESAWHSWARIAGDNLARDLGLFAEAERKYWQLAEMPEGMGLFEQSSRSTSSENGIRLDRFVFGHDGKKLRSAIALGRHLAFLIRDEPGMCPCDCRFSLPVDPNASSRGPTSRTRTKSPTAGSSVKASSPTSNAGTSIAPAPSKKRRASELGAGSSASKATSRAPMSTSASTSTPSFAPAPPAAPPSSTSWAARTARAARPSLGSVRAKEAESDLYARSYTTSRSTKRRKSSSASAADEFSAGSPARGKSTSAGVEGASVDEEDDLRDEDPVSPSTSNIKIDSDELDELGNENKEGGEAEHDNGEGLPEAGSTSARRSSVSKAGTKLASHSSRIPPPAAPRASPVRRQASAARGKTASKLSKLNQTSDAAPASSSRSTPTSRSSSRNAPDPAEYDSIPRVVADTSAIGADMAREKRSSIGKGWGRVGDLVWTWVGEEAAGWWPAVVTGSELVELYLGADGTSQRGPPRKVVALELLACGEERTGVEFGYLKPWLAYSPEGIQPDPTTQWPEVACRQTIKSLVAKGPDAVNATFVLALRVAKWLAAIQLRSPPSLESGRHLIADPNASPDASPLERLKPSVPTAQHFAHAWVSLGSEVLFAGDLVRIAPTADLPYFAKDNWTGAATMSTCLVLRVVKFLRGAAGSPLLVRGHLLEMIEGDASSAAAAVAEGPEPPLPGFYWRAVAPSVDLLAEHIAGRYVPMIKEDMHALFADAAADRARDEAIRTLALGGVIVPGWEDLYPSLLAPNSIKGGTEDRLAVAEDAAMMELTEYQLSFLPPDQ